MSINSSKNMCFHDLKQKRLNLGKEIILVLKLPLQTLYTL